MTVVVAQWVAGVPLRIGPNVFPFSPLIYLIAKR